MNLNRISLIGNITADPVARTLPTGQSLARFGLATTRVFREAKSKERRQRVEFHTVVAWGKLADIIRQYVKKGTHVYIEGRMQTRRWKTKRGEPRTTTEVVANNLIMLGHRSRPSEPEPMLSESQCCKAPMLDGVQCETCGSDGIIEDDGDVQTP